MAVRRQSPRRHTRPRTPESGNLRAVHPRAPNLQQGQILGDRRAFAGNETSTRPLTVTAAMPGPRRLS
jgi:hypothetical protein